MCRYNPQYNLRVTVPAAATRRLDTKSVWLLLSRHMTAAREAGDDRKQDFLGIALYKGGERGGRRIFYPSLPPAWLRTVLTNEPHVLLRCAPR